MSSLLAVVERFPRVRLGHAPTPLDPAPHLGAVLGIELWIKRDDCTGLACGFWCRQPTGIGDNGLWSIRKLSGILYLPDVGSMTTSFSSAFAGIFASN